MNTIIAFRKILFAAYTLILANAIFISCSSPSHKSGASITIQSDIKGLEKASMMYCDGNYILGANPEKKEISLTKQPAIIDFQNNRAISVLLMESEVILEPDETAVFTLTDGSQAQEKKTSIQAKYKGNLLWRNRLKSLQSGLEPLIYDKSVNMIDVKAKLEENLADIQRSFSNFKKENSVSANANEIFEREMRYIYLNNLCNAAVFRKKDNAPMYKDLFKDISFSNITDTVLLLNSTIYRQFLMHYLNDISTDFIPQNYLEPDVFKNQLLKALKVKDMLTRDFLLGKIYFYYSFMKNNLKDDVSALETDAKACLENINTPLFKNVFSNSTVNPQPNNDNTLLADVELENQQGSGPLFLAEEISKLANSNKVVVIDVWASWCGPCLNEFKFYKKMIADSDSSKVVFVFISIDENKDDWKNKLLQIDLGKKAKHYLINNIYSIKRFRDFYKIAEIPRVMLIRKDGKIAIPSAAVPSQEGLLEREIDNLVKRL